MRSRFDTADLMQISPADLLGMLRADVVSLAFGAILVVVGLLTLGLLAMAACDWLRCCGLESSRFFMVCACSPAPRRFVSTPTGPATSSPLRSLLAC
jgi:hypothetical protein